MERRPDEVFETLLVGRWSCRAFRDVDVPVAVIERLLLLSQRSPSWCNTQPWQVVVTHAPATARLREALTAHAAVCDDDCCPDLPMPERYEGVHLGRRRESGWQLYEALGIKRGDREGAAAQALRNLEFFDAPHVATITTDASLGVYGAVDAGLYIGAFLLAAQSLGIAAIAQAAIARHGQFLHSHLGIADTRKVVVGIAFGYPDLEHPANSFRTARADLPDVVRWIS
jgi:nitroreductase